MMNSQYDNANKDNTIIYNHLKIDTDIGLSETPMGFTPRELYNYYNFTGEPKGRGKTIALIDAYDYPDAEEDLRKFSTEFSLPMPDFEIVYPQQKPEERNGDWNLEAALDIQWAHAMAPCAKIMLVLAADATTKNLYDAVDFAVKRGADIISMSWGARESEAVLEYESHFRGKEAIFVASAGDKGGITEYPSSSQYVLSVGGTLINTNKFGNPVSESAWSESGGGPSRYIKMPGWQKKFGLEKLAGIYRATPDVAFDAAPYSGVSVYYTHEDTGKSSWIILGGTSLSSPSWAGIIASVFTRYTRTEEVARKLYDLAGGTSYTNVKRCFHDITTGEAGKYEASKGYDFITGLGSPDIDNIRRFSSSQMINRQC